MCRHLPDLRNFPWTPEQGIEREDDTMKPGNYNEDLSGSSERRWNFQKYRGAGIFDLSWDR
jgi:hypothetical protein